MKAIKLVLLGLILSVPRFAFAVPFVELQTGMIASPGSVAPIYGVRGVASGVKHEFSLGYWCARGMSSDRLVSGGLDLHVLSAELYRKFDVAPKVTGKLGGGIGYTIPNLDGGASETADNGHSWVFGGGVNYAVTSSVDLGATVKGFFFTTDTHVTTYGSHLEQLISNGALTGTFVSVLDEAHQDDVVNFNSVLFQISLRWK